MANDNSLRSLTSQFTKPGKLEAIYLRPARDAPCVSVQQAIAIAKRGLEGDRAAQRASTKQLGSNPPSHVDAGRAYPRHRQPDRHGV